MKSKIAIVLGFSESCQALAIQCILSCCKALALCQNKYEIYFYPYKCNWVRNQQRANPFSSYVDFANMLPGLDMEFCIQDASQIKWDSPLPDISIYHHFTNVFLDDFDYVLYCHNDIFFRPLPFMDRATNVLCDERYNIIADTSLSCNQDLSARFQPSFILVKRDKFREANLSFCNEHKILSDEMKAYPIQIDGGGGLLASYYSKNNTIDAMPFTRVKQWFRHLRVDSDYGVEMYNILYPDTHHFREIIEKAQRYIDFQTSTS